MLCEKCKQRDATVHLTGATIIDAQSGAEPSVEKHEHHFCQQCANGYFADDPALSSFRNLICLSDSFRSRLYDLLEADHPKAFYDGEDDLQLMSASEVMNTLLRRQLKKEKIEVNQEVFMMLFLDFIGSRDFYTRREEHKKKGG